MDQDHQDHQDHQEPPQPAPGMTAPMRVAVVVLTTCCAMIAILWVYGVYGLLMSPDYAGEGFNNDFSVFWAAARLANEGRWLAPFDVDILNAARSIPPTTEHYEMIWFYPPAYLVLLWPLGKLSFFWAWIMFCAVSLAFFAVAIRGPTRSVPGAFWFLVCAPVTMLLLTLGQNSLIFCGLLVVAVEAMRRGQPMVAGLALALMTLKPQLGLVIPFALAAGGYWRVLVWACIFTALIVLATLVFPGLDYWTAFFRGIAAGSDRLRQPELEYLMVSAYGTLAAAGVPRDLALQLQAVITVTTLVSLVWLWRRDVPFDVKAAGLFFSIILATPYAVYYELIFPLCGALYSARAGYGKTRPQAILLLSIWILPVIGTVAISAQEPGYIFALVVLAACLVVTLRRSSRA